MMKPPPGPRSETRYWAALFAAAILAGVWVHYRLSDANPPCLGEDCPMPGTVAHQRIVELAREAAPRTAAMMAGGVLVVGVLVRGLMHLLRRRGGGK